MTYLRNEALYAIIPIDDGARWVVQRFAPLSLRITSTWYFTSVAAAYQEMIWQQDMDRERTDEAREQRVKRRSVYDVDD